MRYRIASRTGLMLAATAVAGLAGPIQAQNTSHSGGHTSLAMQPPPPPPPAPPLPPPPSDPIDAVQLPICSATVTDGCREKAAAPMRAYRARHMRRPR